MRRKNEKKLLQRRNPNGQMVHEKCSVTNHQGKTYQNDEMPLYNKDTNTYHKE